MLERIKSFLGLTPDNWGLEMIRAVRTAPKHNYLMINPNSGWPPEQYRVDGKEQRDALLARGWLWVAGGVVPARSVQDEMADARLSG